MAKEIIWRLVLDGTDDQNQKLEQTKRQIVETEQALQKLKKETKGNVEAQKAQAGEMARLETLLKALKSEYSQQQKSILDNAKATKNAAGSYDELVQQTAELRKQLRALPDAFNPNNKAAQALASQIKNNHDRLKEFDATMGMHQRNVGNYEQAVMKGIGSLKSFAIGAVAAAVSIDSIIGFLSSSTEAFLESERASRRLERAVFNVGGEGSKAVQKLSDQARQLSKDLLIFSTGEIKTQQTFLVNLGLTADQVERLTPKLLDYAAANELDLSQATDKAINAINGQTKGLKESGDAFDDTGSKTQNLNILLEKFSKYAGAAANELTTVEGRTKRVEKAWGDFKESIGEMIVNEGNMLLDFFDVMSGKLTVAEAAVNSMEARFGIIGAGTEAFQGASTEARLKALEALKKEWEEIRDLDDVASNMRKQVLLQQMKGINQVLEEEQRNSKATRTKILNDETEEGERRRKEAIEKAKKHADEMARLAEEEARYQAKIQQELEDAIIAGMTDHREREIAQVKLTLSRRLAEIKGFGDEEVALRKQITENAMRQIIQIEAKYMSQEEQEWEKQSKAYIDQIAARIQAKEKAEKEAADREKKMREEAEKALVDESLKLAQQLNDSVFASRKAAIERERDEKISALEDEKDTAVFLLEQQLQQGQITQQQFQQQKMLLDQQFQQRELQLKREAFEKEKEQAIKKIYVDLSLAITNIWSRHAANPIVASILTGGVTGTALFQIAEIRRQKFARGGILKGPSHAEGGIQTPFGELEGGEGVINKKSMAIPGVMEIASLLNELGGGIAFRRGSYRPIMAQGGITPSLPVAGYITASDLMRFAEVIKNGINDQQVYVVEGDIRGATKKAYVNESTGRFR